LIYYFYHTIFPYSFSVYIRVIYCKTVHLPYNLAFLQIFPNFIRFYFCHTNPNDFLSHLIYRFLYRTMAVNQHFLFESGMRPLENSIYLICSMFTDYCRFMLVPFFWWIQRQLFNDNIWLYYYCKFLTSWLTAELTQNKL